MQYPILLITSVEIFLGLGIFTENELKILPSSFFFFSFSFFCPPRKQFWWVPWDCDVITRRLAQLRRGEHSDPWGSLPIKTQSMGLHQP